MFRAVCVVVLFFAILFNDQLSADEIGNLQSMPPSVSITQDRDKTKLLNWVQAHVSFITKLPLSFYVPLETRARIYSQMGPEDSVPGIIERMIVEEGLDIYDGAVGQIVLTMLGTPEALAQAYHPLEVYWGGYLGELQTIRAGYPQQPFVYDPKDPYAVSSDLNAVGKRGFIFRIINANGRYATSDPLDGKKSFEHFPSWPTIHWEDWKPIAGENAWVAIAAMQLLDKRFYDGKTNTYRPISSAVELKLAEELARAAILLQSEVGGIRMAPIGTYREAVEERTADHEQNTWWYHQISTENNISWYSAMRMLYQVTGQPIYRESMKKIEEYMKKVWNKKQNYFYQGMTYQNGEWVPNKTDFALDVQTWSIGAFGAGTIDEWFGEGTAYRMWQVSKTLSGAWNANGQLLGVGYTHEHDRVSVEWTAGAIMALNEMADHYREAHPEWRAKLLEDAVMMRRGIESLRHELSPQQAAYAYSSHRGWIPFGWNSHDPDVLSLASTGWVVFIDSRYNPFYLSSRQKASAGLP